MPLEHVSDTEPGIRRRRAGRGFRYLGPDGAPLPPDEVARVRALAVPPAWTDVWICPLPHGHIQATGRDAAGRKQYRYHPDWQASQSETKFAQLQAFGLALPTLRRRVERDLRQDPGARAFSLAALILLLDRACLRVGNLEYAEQNGSFGATTLRRRHLSIKDGEVRLAYRAKGGKRVRQVLRDRRLHRILNTIGDLPGRNLFTYVDDAGEVRSIGSADVNAWLAEVTEPGITAKVFRTWGGTLAAFALAEATPGDARLSPRALAEAAAERLHNTPAICRKSYIHPRVMDLSALQPEARAARLAGIAPLDLPGLRAPEQRLMGLLAE